MPKIDDVANLIRVIGSKDYNRARKQVEAMIANERHAKREQAAKTLEHALNKYWTQTMIELPYDLKNLLWSKEPQHNLYELYLVEDVALEVQRFLRERAEIEKLREASLPVRNRVLLAGPPGNGKTSLAECIAKELELPLLSIKLSGVIDSHLGETSKSIGKVLDYSMYNNCLLFIDELDAIGSARKSAEGGAAGREYNLIVNTLLTGLDNLPDTTVLMAATNMPELIDPALTRRFDLKLWLDVPGADAIYRYVSDYQGKHGIFLGGEFDNLVGQPWSKIAQTCLDNHRALVLGEQSVSGVDWIGRNSD